MPTPIEIVDAHIDWAAEFAIIADYFERRSVTRSPADFRVACAHHDDIQARYDRAKEARFHADLA